MFRIPGISNGEWYNPIIRENYYPLYPATAKIRFISYEYGSILSTMQ